MAKQAAESLVADDLTRLFRLALFREVSQRRVAEPLVRAVEDERQRSPLQRPAISL
jgi:hypothetical protein